jgi:hypothetical protein
MASKGRRIFLAGLTASFAMTGLAALPAAASAAPARSDAPATTQTFFGNDPVEGTAISYAYLAAELGGYKASQCHVISIEPEWTVTVSCTK